ncbi:energy-coupling factor transporter transmembrane component T family protein [Holzapfeliella floricola]|uniref:ABC superfamily ATP binding cassette transporter, membrane protein n=1 Tax=Holzapfeliella floricola DSM 23037 = JCM 16512 TaxID=1423744 RepID=A0A0R2DKP6_9LACO|nr:energy-coupling factor transporter transmembrane component T [Holzapfeliella floricola]KRN04262.1 ABC superfamily ATP binding cassette transporter, membrane protein [Holzapfeliella floricola DSM 23037 = JCM 16512]
MDRFLLGQYIYGNSYVHRLDPRAKLLGTFAFIILIFLANNFWTYGVIVLFTLFAAYMTKISAKIYWQGLRPMLWLMIFTVTLQILFTSGGDIYLKWGIITISQYGIINSIFILVRLSTIIFMSTILTITTPPMLIADAFASLLKPLKKVKFPVDQFSMICSIALRFVPTLMETATKIMNAQRARGASFNDGNIIKRIKSIIPMLIPLLINSMKIAIDLAESMTARNYQLGEPRTQFRRLRWHKTDLYVLYYFAILTLLLIVLRRF